MDTNQNPIKGKLIYIHTIDGIHTVRSQIMDLGESGNNRNNNDKL